VLTELLKKEFLLEFRQKSALGGVLVYVAGTIFVSALCFKGRLDKPSWNALFWIISLFTSVTISGRSFLRESGGAALFSYLYYRPGSFVLGKCLYNMIFMLALSLVTFFFYGFFIRNEVENLLLFLLVLVLAGTGLAAVLTLMSAIASKAGGSFSMMSILSLPVLMPMILVVIRLSKQAVDGIEWAGVNQGFIWILVALNAMSLALAWLLFPYVWKE
jgi:heme exporter protein B